MKNIAVKSNFFNDNNRLKKLSANLKLLFTNPTYSRILRKRANI